MFCSKCGTKLEDNAKFCSQCGASITGGGGSVSYNIQSITSSVISTLRNLDKKKALYGIIISLVFVFLFGCTTVKAFNPAKKVKAEVTYASEPYTDYSTGTFYRDTYYQRVSITYKGKEYTGIREVGFYNPYGTIDTSISTGQKLTAYIVDGQLVLNKDSVKISIIVVGFSTLLLLSSIGSCSWFTVQYFKRR